jgi:cell division protein FtsQ
MRRAGSWLFIIAALAAGLPLLGYAGYQQVMTSDYFKAKNILIEGAQRLSREEVLATAGLNQPDALNLLQAEPATIIDNIKRHPWIADADVKIELPDTLHIKVRERQLLGMVSDDRLYLVDTQGEVIKPLAPEDAVDGPIVSGFSDLTHAAPDARQALLTAFALIEHYNAMGLSRWAELAEVHHDPHLGYTLFTSGDQGIEVRLGFDRLPARLQRLSQVTSVLESNDLRAEYVLIDQPDDLDRVVVKPIPRVVPPPPPPEPPQKNNSAARKPSRSQ